MSTQVCTGAMMMCSFGLAPSTLNATPKTQMVSKMPAATIMDMVPFVNVPPFGMCTTPSNPAVAAATAAAMGVPTPMPCTPVIPAPWTPCSPTVLYNGQPALSQSSTLMCAYGGCITISYPGQVLVQLK